MATYYKYAERDATSQINWAEIGKNMTDMLANETKVREQKKAAIDQASRDYAEVLANSPMGESESARAMAIKFGDNASQFMRMQDKLLKSGQLRLGDYTGMRQNLLDDTDTAFNMLKEYQAKYKEKMDRYKNTDSQEYELESMERIEGFGRFSESGLYIDPTTGKVSIAMMDKDEATGGYTMSKNPNKMANINTVRGLLLGEWNRYKPDEGLDYVADSMGEYVKTVREIGSRTKAGQIVSVTDVLANVKEAKEITDAIAAKTAEMNAITGTDKKSVQKKNALAAEIKSLEGDNEINASAQEFIKAETAAIGSLLQNPWDKLSLITDIVQKAPNGEKYYFERDPEKAKGNPAAILMVPTKDNNGSETPQFTPEQEEVATNWMKGQLRRRYDYKEQRQAVGDYQAPSYAPQYVYAAGQQKKLEEDMVSQWMKIYTAKTAADKDAAAEALLGTLQNVNAGVIDVDPTATGVTIKYADGRSIPIEYAQGGAGGAAYKSGDQWAAAGTILHGVKDQNIYNKFRGSTFSNLTDANEWNQVGAAYSMPTTTTDTGVDRKQILDSKLAQISPSTFKSSDNDVAAYLTQELGPLGFTFTSNNGGYLNQYVTVTPPSGPSFTLDTNEKGDGTGTRNKLLSQIETMLDGQDPNKILKGGGVGSNYNPKPE